MKKFTFALMALLAFTFSLKAQQFVSTEPANRNVILEEFTGRNCGYCTDGHRIANELMAAHPGRLWAINIHAGGYAPTSYPNMITQDGNTIHGGFSISGYPTGVVNRTTGNGIDRGQWGNQANNQLNQASECNIAGMAVINPQTRTATITVEVYYTGNSTVDQNYLTVAMLQDSILGSQADYGNYNPTQWVGNQYCHMHVLRDVISESAWGDPISPTTQGTLITRTYEYEIPEIIGSPNGVEVDIDNIFFLAWVAERQQGNAYRPILGAIFYNNKNRVQNGLIQDRGEIVREFPLRQIITWKRKGAINFNAGYFLPTTEQIYLICRKPFKLAKGANKFTDVWEIAQEMNNPHPAPFPEELIDRIVQSTTGQIVLDPFCGSGTTAVSAKKFGRDFIMIEQSIKYCNLAFARISGKEDWRNVQ